MTIIRLISTLLVLSSFAGATDWTTPTQVPMAASSWDWCMPSISADGQKLFFASDSDGIANGPYGLYYADWLGTAWSEQVFMGPAFGGDGPKISPCIGYDDTTLYFAKGYFIGDSIFASYYTGGVWKTPVPLDSINKSGDAGGPAISKDGSTLYFHSNRPGGYGGYDIWKSARSGGVWQAPVNMGPLVNTAVDELEPGIAGNDSDFVFCRVGVAVVDTANIWYCRIGTGDAPVCIIYGHYVPLPGYSNWYRSPCISWDGQRIFLEYQEDNIEPISYIHVSNRVTGVAGGPGEQAVSSLQLGRSRPDPARYTTTISFSLPRAGAYRLNVFNLLGQQVKAFAGSGVAGANAVTWNFVAVPNGVYFYQLGFEGKMTTQRMVVLK